MRKSYSLVRAVLRREITIREKATAKIRRIAGIRENSVNPYTDTLASVKRAKQAAGTTLCIVLLPLQSGYCVIV
jgi:hypothetical protein